MVASAGCLSFTTGYPAGCSGELPFGVSLVFLIITKLRVRILPGGAVTVVGAVGCDYLLNSGEKPKSSSSSMSNGDSFSVESAVKFF